MIFGKKLREIKRTRKVFKTLRLPKTGKVLDVSCGGGRLLKTIENSFVDLGLFGVDITPGYMALHPELSKINFSTAKADSLTFSDNTFDVVICSMSMHHYEDINGVLNEINRISKLGAQIYLIDILPKNKWLQYLYNLIGCHEPYHFEKFYTVQEIIKLCAHQGFRFVNSERISILPDVNSLRFSK